MDLSEREDQTSDPDEEDTECRKMSKKIANVTLESDSLPEASQTAEERIVRRKKRIKRKGQQMDIDPTPKTKSDSKYMDCDGFESHISSSDESYSGDNRGQEADDEQSDWVGDTTPTRTVSESPFDRRLHIRRSQPTVHPTSSMQKKVEKFAREGGRGELVLEVRARDRAASSLLQRYIYKYHLEVVVFMGKCKGGNQISSDFARLGVRIELPDKRPFAIDQFELFVHEAIREVFGSCGPIVKISEYDDSLRRGSVVAPGDEIQQVWAALSSKGLFQGHRIAAHLHTLTETSAANLF